MRRCGSSATWPTPRCRAGTRANVRTGTTPSISRYHRGWLAPAARKSTTRAPNDGRHCGGRR
jgi:hypothetical protein